MLEYGTPTIAMTGNKHHQPAGQVAVSARRGCLSGNDRCHFSKRTVQKCECRSEVSYVVLPVVLRSPPKRYCKQNDDFFKLGIRSLWAQCWDRKLCRCNVRVDFQMRLVFIVSVSMGMWVTDCGPAVVAMLVSVYMLE